MPSKLSYTPRWIDDRQKFSRMLKDFSDERQLAVDTESNSLFAYEEKVCLMQFSSSTEDFIVDALAALPFTGLGKIFADASIEKIFHAAEYDLICLKRGFGYSFNNLFDTMHAARVLGEEKLGLSNMLEEQFGVLQGHSYQKADWGKRPLSDEMLAYACMDTHYLIRLRDILEDRLIRAERLELAREDFVRLCAVEPNHRSELLYTQVNGYHTLAPQELRVLDELCRFRDQMARKLDRPHFKVLGNNALIAAARAQPASEDQLTTLEGISPRVAQRYAPALLQAVKHGLSLPPLELDHRRRPSQNYINRLEALKQWRKQAALKMRVQSDIVLPREVMEEIAKVNPRDAQALQQEMHSVPWRFRHFGDDILKVIRQGK